MRFLCTALREIRVLRYLAAAWLLGALTAHAGNYGYNLVANGDAESVPTASTALQSFPGWISDGIVSIHAYGWGNWAYPATPGPDTRGNNFFRGGNAATSQAWQRIDLDFASPDIDAGKVIYDFSAWIGGYEYQSDQSAVALAFLDAEGQPISNVLPILGPVTVDERSGTTQALPRAAVNMVPVGARSALVLMNFSRDTGSDSDGYIDDISLILSLTPGTARALVSCAATLNANNALDIDRLDFQDSAYGARMQLATAADGSITGKLVEAYPARKTGCPVSDVGAVVINVDGGWVLHIPTLAMGANQYWAQFGIETTPVNTTQFRLQGLGPALPNESGQGSAFRALSKTNSIQKTGNRFVHDLTFPDATVHQVSINLTPDQSNTPTPEQLSTIARLSSRAWGLSTQLSNTTSGYQLTASYFVPYESLPADVIAQIRSSAGLSASAIPRQSKAAGAVSGVVVEINSAGSTLGIFGKEGAGRLAEKGFTQLMQKDGKAVGSAVGTVFDAAEAFSAVEQHMSWRDRMTESQRCLNATITDATVKQQLGNALGQARQEVNINAGVNYMAMVASKVIGLIQTEIPIFIGTGLLTDTVGEAVKTSNEERVREVESAAGRCDHRWRVEFEGSGTYNISGADGLSYSSTSRTIRTTNVSYNWKITRNKVVFKDNTRGKLTPIYGKNHAIDYQNNSRTISGSYHHSVQGPSINEVCQGEVYDALWETGGMEITDNRMEPYPPTPEFFVKIPGFTGVRWRGTCVTNGNTSAADNSITLGIPVRATFDLPADFRFNPVEIPVAGTDSITTSSGQSRNTQWTGAVRFIPY